MMVALEEYKTLRQELLNSMAAQHTIIGFGVVALGLLVNIVFQKDVPAALASVTALAAVPFASLLVASLFLNEVARGLRLGLHLVDLEARINAVTGPGSGGPRGEALSWTRRVHARPRRHAGLTNFSILAAFLTTVSVALVAQAVVRLSQGDVDPDQKLLAATTAAGALVLGAYLLTRVVREYRLAKDPWGSV